MSRTSDCFICNSLRGTGDIPWTDRPLLFDPRYGGIIPGVGALIPGYVLLCPKEHFPNFCATAATPEMVSFTEHMLGFLAERLGQLTYFEHGGEVTNSVPTSACVDHAHIHVVPGYIPLEIPADGKRYASLADFLASRETEWVHGPYLMLGHTDGECRVAEDIGVSQYFRRQLARVLNHADCWDYAAAPMLDQVQKTIEMLIGSGE